MSAKQMHPETIYLQDYQVPDFLIDTVTLSFELDEDTTRVSSEMQLRRNSQAKNQARDRPLVLNGNELELISVTLNGKLLTTEEYQADSESLAIADVPDAFTLQVVTEIHPAANTSLGGLYTSGGNFCTQCEAEDFRKISFFLDRPDVMARYRTHIVANKSRYPVLLSNGNLVDCGEMEDGRHWASWEDPFPKPSYLFALVAGDLARISDQFTTCSGRVVDLHLYVQHHNVDKCEHAMRSLKKAMAWDEQRYGREYDLDLYMIVAVDDFNMGAMENKGLNVFNSRYVLARPDTATDQDYQDIESVIGHEYFHNWSGNRVTCRDWFQLSLKEGFTVYRDEEFSADMGSRGVKRIEDVNILRAHQFREDAGPMAHPVRPDSYVEINNFYTVTVYNKGAEVVRMLAHLVGEQGFRKGTDLYFQRHDGQAVTTDDFVKALEDANHKDFTQFKRWYSQAGTPLLTISQDYDAQQQSYRLKVKQSCPATPGQEEKLPFHIPLAVGLLNAKGEDMALCLAGETQSVIGTRVLNIREPEQVFEFVKVKEKPVPSLLRDFSAPVKLETDLSDEEYYFLMGHDSDAFNRWEAGQHMAMNTIMRLAADWQQAKPLLLDNAFVEAVQKTLTDTRLDKSLISAALNLPSETYLSEFMTPVDPVAIHKARRFVYASLAQQLQDSFLRLYHDNHTPGEYRLDADAIGRRALKNRCLSYLMQLDDARARELCMAQFAAGENMTDVISALACLVNSAGPERQQAIAEFYEQWQADPLVVDKWLRLQAMSYLPDTLDRVLELTTHQAFNIKNPNKVRSLIGAFSAGNQIGFHAEDGSGYSFLADYVMALDKLNPQLAARMCNAFTQWRRYDAARQALMKESLESIRAMSGLSRDVYEVVSKSLA